MVYNRMLARLTLRALMPMLLAVGPMAQAAPAVASESSLFAVKGREVPTSELTPAEQEQWGEIEAEAYARKVQLLEQAALSRWLDQEAKAQGRSRADFEAKVLNAAAPTEPEAKAWFEANKSRLPPGYTFEQVGEEIKAHLRDQGLRDKRAALITKLKLDGALVLKISSPKLPQQVISLDGFPAKGPKQAPVTLVEFADYQCSHCQAAAVAIDEAMSAFRDQVKVVFVDFPIKGAYSERAAFGAACAGEQGKFWQFHDLAFKEQMTLGVDGAVAALASKLGLDGGKFATCLASNIGPKRVAAGKAEGERLGLTGTPALFLNGRRLRSYERTALSAEIARALQDLKLKH